MMERPLACPRCALQLPVTLEELERIERCPECHGRLEIEVFPALFRPVQTGTAPASVISDGDASCFYHPQKMAVLPCDVCGRFLCALCDIEWDSRHVCPGCLNSEGRKGRLPGLNNRRVLYDSLALTLAVLPLLVWPATFVTAPAAIFLSIRHWKSPGSIIPRTKLRFVLATVVSLIQLAVWGTLAWSIFRKH